MGLFDKAKDLAAEHADKIREGIERAGDLIDEKTGGTYADQVDKGQDFARDRLGEFAGREGTGEPAAPTAPATESTETAAADGPPPAS